MPLDPQVEKMLSGIRAASREYWQMTPAEARDWHIRKGGLLDIKPDPVFRVENRVLETEPVAVPVRIFTPRESNEPFPILVWLHGGGHVVGSLDSYDALCRQLALQADCIVVSVDYRLAPEHKFPAGVEDSFAALDWVLLHAQEIGGDAARVAIGGDSAGANLAAVCAILARDASDEGRASLNFQLLVYPRTAAEEEFDSHHEYAEGYLLTRKTILWFHDHYRATDADRNDFRYAPLICPDLSRLPPALVIVGEYDPLKDDGIAYALRLARSGNTVELAHYAGMVHPFFSMGGVIDVGKRALTRAATALKLSFASA